MNADPQLSKMCEKVQGQLDVCLDGGAPLLEPEAASHLKTCPLCAAELDARRALRNRLRTAVSAIQPPSTLPVKVRAILAEHTGPSAGFPIWKLAGLAAALALCIGGAALFQFQSRFRPPAGIVGGVSNPPAHVSVPPLMAVGLSDHVHCALARRYPATADTARVMETELGPEYRGVLPVVQSHMPPGCIVVMGHHCAYKDRRFVHLILKDREGRLISVVLTRKRANESFAKDLVPALSEGGIPLYQSSTGQLQIASLETRDHLVYVVSDLPPTTNIATIAAMARGVRRFLTKLEG